MSSPPPTARRGLEAFAYRDFRWYQYARVAAILGAEAQSVAVAWQVYSLTHRALDLGYTGLALFLPGLIFLLPAGHVADKFERRHIILVCYALQFFATIALLSIALLHLNNILAIYAVLFLIGTGRAFPDQPARLFCPKSSRKNISSMLSPGALPLFNSPTSLAPLWAESCLRCHSQ